MTEELTSTEFTSTASVDLKSTNIKLENLYHLKTIKPGLTYTAYVSCIPLLNQTLLDSVLSFGLQQTFSVDLLLRLRYKQDEDFAVMLSFQSITQETLRRRCTCRLLLAAPLLYPLCQYLSIGCISHSFLRVYHFAGAYQVLTLKF